MQKTLFPSFLLLALSAVPHLAVAQNNWQASPTQQSEGLVSSEKPPEFEGIGIDEKLGAKLDLSLLVTDESGKTLPLSTYFTGNRPVILSLVYFNCPGLCNYHLNGLTDAFKKMEWSPGQNFEVISMSFDPKENSETAAKKKLNYLKLYGRTGVENGWHFVTASAATIKSVTEEVGFKYRWDEKNNDWSHASAAIVVSPEGKISRYLHGILFEPRDVKLALLDSVNGKTGSIADRLVWYCFHYDQHQSKYSLMVFRIVQFVGGFFVLILSAFLVPFYLRSKKETAEV